MRVLGNVEVVDLKTEALESGKCLTPTVGFTIATQTICPLAVIDDADPAAGTPTRSPLA